MGTVYAKDIGQSANKNTSHSERSSHHTRGSKGDDEDVEIPTMNFQAKARVDKIHIDGLMRTKEDFVVDSVKDLFKAKDFQEVLIGAHKVRGKLESLGCFRHIGIFIDTSHGPESTPYGYEVTFYVHELNRMMGGAKTLVGNNEGSVVLGLRLPNMFGRGERLATEYSYGSKRTSGFNFSFVKPLKGSFSHVLTATILQSLSEWPWSGYKQIDRGILLDYMFSMPDLAGVKHNVQWEGTWCEVMCLSKTTAFPVREEAGHKVKSSVRHTMSVDTRDTPIFPTSGFLLRMRNEFAGLGGNVGFLKHDFALETNWSILPQVVLQGTLQGGLMTQVNKNLKIGISDRFFLGGPPSLRGFRTRGVGPHVDNCALGGNAFWAAGFHIFTPLPFNPGKGGLGELFRTHLFINSGALNGVETTELPEIWQKLREDFRTTYGVGIALRLGQMARLELNYCLPLSHKRCDQLESGFQFGFGIQFI